MGNTDTVIGIDAGYCMPGVAVMRCGQVIHAEAVRTKALSAKARKAAGTSKAADDAARMNQISDRLAELISEHKPARAVIEAPVGGGRSSNAVKAMAMGLIVATITCHRLGVPVACVTPQRNKKAATGKLDAEKDEMIAAAKWLHPEFTAWPRMAKDAAREDPDRCAAIADAICVLHAD